MVRKGRGDRKGKRRREEKGAKLGRWQQ